MDINFQGQQETILGVEVVGQAFLSRNTGLSVIIALGDNESRRRWFSEALLLGHSIIRLFHPSSVVSGFATISRGTFINAGAVVQAGAVIEENCIINSGASVDHEAVVGAHSHVGPGARIAGRVKIGESSFIGMGASVIQGKKLGRNVTVGAGAVVTKDLMDSVTAVGIPAEELRK